MSSEQIRFRCVLGRGVFASLVFLCWLTTTRLTLASDFGLSAGPNGELQLNGRPFRGIGVNYYDAFVRLLAKGEIGDVEKGFQVLASNQIPFIRFSAGGYWPVDWSLYQTNREEYFARLDAVVNLARRYGIGLIPSLFWYPPTISDLVGEPVNQWGNPASQTRAFMRAYVREVVNRYAASPSIWAWEFGNEFNLPADLPNAAEHRPPVQPALGTATIRSENDDLTHSEIRTALSEFAREVRRYDAHRLILSGNAFPRNSAWHQMQEHTWSKDSPAQWSQMLTEDNPDLISSICGRLYSTNDLAHLSLAREQSRQSGKTLVVGEFGVPGPMTESNRRQFAGYLSALDTSGVPLAALWVFDFSAQKKDWNVTAENDRQDQLRQVADLNRRWRQPGFATEPFKQGTILTTNQ